jgi:hypothetical protein
MLSTSPSGSSPPKSRFAEADGDEETEPAAAAAPAGAKLFTSVLKKPLSEFGVPVQPKPGALAGRISVLGSNVRPDLGRVGSRRHPPPAPPTTGNQKEEEMGALSFLSFGRKGGLF